MTDYSSRICRIHKKPCDKWSEVAGCGFNHCPYSKKKEEPNQERLELKPYPFEYFNINAPEMKFEDNVLKFQQKIYAECMDMKEHAILDAVIRAAREAGVTELFLLDKQFVVNALTAALEKWREENG